MDKITDVLHISNTDVESDSRIRKELRSLSALPGVRISVVGTPDVDGEGSPQLDGAQYHKVRLLSRSLGLLPRAIRYFFQLIEFTIRAVAAGRRIMPRVVHCHDTFALPAGWILKRQLGCRLVYDAHELESDKNEQNPILSWSTLLIEKICWKRVDLLISVSRSIIDWYELNLGDKPSVLVLNAPIVKSDSCMDPVTQERGRYFHEKYSIPAGCPVFVYLGLLSPGRGIEICLDAFAAGPIDAHVVFIGFGRLKGSILEYAARRPNIHFHQAVPHDQVVPLVQSADYGLCLIERTSLSAYYCLPNKLFEYAFARIPVLASGFPEIGRLVDQYSLGVCCDPDPDRVREALGQLLRRKAARVTSDMTELSWETQALRLRAAYRDRLLAPAGAGSSM